MRVASGGEVRCKRVQGQAFAWCTHCENRQRGGILANARLSTVDTGHLARTLGARDLTDCEIDSRLARHNCTAEGPGSWR